MENYLVVLILSVFVLLGALYVTIVEQKIIKIKDELLQHGHEIRNGKEGLDSTNKALKEVKIELESTIKELTQVKLEFKLTNKALIQVKVELESTRKELKQVQVEFESTKKELKQAQVELESTKTEVKKAQVELKSTRNELQKVKVELDKIITEMSRPCEKGWIKFGIHCYYIGPNSKTWDDSVTDCQRKGSNLVKVEDATENLWLQTVMIANNIDMLRIGAHDLHHEGTWRWISDNSAVDYTNWGVGQPDDAGRNEDCAELWKAVSYLWNDRPCSSLLRYICEK